MPGRQPPAVHAVPHLPAAGCQPRIGMRGAVGEAGSLRRLRLRVVAQSCNSDAGRMRGPRLRTSARWRGAPRWAFRWAGRAGPRRSGRRRGPSLPEVRQELATRQGGATASGPRAFPAVPVAWPLPGLTIWLGARSVAASGVLPGVRLPRLAGRACGAWRRGPLGRRLVFPQPGWLCLGPGVAVAVGLLDFGWGHRRDRRARRQASRYCLPQE